MKVFYVAGNFESSTTQVTNDKLEASNTEDDTNEEHILGDTTKDVLFFMDLSSIDEVEDLAEDESVEDDSVMSGGTKGILESFVIIRFFINVVRSSRSDVFSISRVIFVFTRVLVDEFVGEIFRDPFITREDQDHHYGELVDSLSENVLHHLLKKLVSIHF